MAGYLADDSVLRRVIGENVVALSGPRALLMMASHPVAFEGFFAHTGSLADPYTRLRRTASVLDLIAWGDDREAADRATARVRAMHTRVRGRTAEAVGRFPVGTPYRGDDPELLLWILASMADSAALVYTKYVAGLDDDELDALWADYRVVGRLFGLRDQDMPADWRAFRTYVSALLASGDLVVTDRARELAIDIVLNPPAPLAARPLVALVNQITVGLLPRDLRRQYGLRWDPLRHVALESGAVYAKRLLLPFTPGRLRLIGQARAA